MAMDNVFTKTRELAEALIESEAYQKMKAAEDRAMANEEAANTMAAFIEKRAELQGSPRAGRLAKKENINKLLNI